MAVGTARFDVIVVGARCAGAALGQRLAAAGLSVALLDAASLPSDQPTSTHLIHPPGMDELDALGVGGAVRESSPALHAFRLSYDGHQVRLPYREGRAAHCLRRQPLDGLLQQSAAAAGADLRPENKVIDLVYDDSGAVGGVVVQRRRQTRERLLADLVVGADGRNSTIAKLVGAQEYLGYDGPRSVYWAYWQRPPDWSPHEYDNGFEGLSARVIFPTDRDQLLIATVPPLDVAQLWRGNHTAAYLADIRGYEPIASHLGDSEPVGQVRGVLKPRYFFRTSVGPGWVLIGDAGHHKEFVIGLGISEALRDAHGLAEALLTRHDGVEIERWWRRRDVERIEMFRWSQDLGRAQPVDALQRLVATRMPSATHLHDRFTDIIDGRLSPYDLIPPGTAARWVAAAALRGDGKVFGPLLDTARRRAGARREMKRLKRRGDQRQQQDAEALDPSS
jgi:2-polyprenyl-6-methoxyphenol hydroxylase-like FAD-dependent oxidoreductase